MPQITAYTNKTDFERWMKLSRKADVIRWLLDQVDAGNVKLPLKSEAKPTGPKAASDSGFVDLGDRFTSSPKPIKLPKDVVSKLKNTSSNICEHGAAPGFCKKAKCKNHKV